LAFWHFSILALWHFGILAFWHFGILAFWHFGRVAIPSQIDFGFVHELALLISGWQDSLLAYKKSKVWHTL
jgi:hypothetical protein